jgi:DNA-binding beta-propeller fold protein YncE
MTGAIRWGGGKVGRLALGGLLVFLAGCATVRDDPKLLKLVWPEAPLAPRIEFVQNVGSERDLGRNSSTGENFMELLTGRKPPIWHLAEPMGLAVSDDGSRLYVTDFGQLAVYVFDFQTRKVTIWGEDKPFKRPLGVALDAQENVYVVEQDAKGITVLTRTGQPVRFITDPSIERPTAIAIDRKHGLIYLADTSRTASENHYVKVFDLKTGKFLRNVGGGKGGKEGQLHFPTYLAVDAQGNLYVADTLNARVSVFSPDGKFLRKVGERGTAFGMFDKPKGVALDTFGNIYVVDSGWSNVQIFNQKGEVLLYFGGRGGYPGLLRNPTGLAIDKRNRIYVADFLNQRVAIYQLLNTRAEDSFVSVPPADKGGEIASQSKASGAPGSRQQNPKKGGEK